MATDQNEDEFDDGIEAEEDGEVARLGKNDLRSLREAAKRGRKAETLEREMAFLKAGVDTDSKAGKIFMRGYDGELDPAQIRSEAEEMGLGRPAGTPGEAPNPNPEAGLPPDTELDEGEAAAIAQRRNAGTQGEPHPEPEKNPFDTASELHRAALENGATREDAMATAFASLVGEAASGNEKVIAGRDGRLKRFD